MTSSRLHDDVPTPVFLPPHGPSVQSIAGHDRLRRGPKAAVPAGQRPVDLGMATPPGTPACPTAVTGSTPASQHEFYHYFGLALLALIAISIVVAARG